MDVDETEVALPTNEWMEAAQRAADTDGILENGPAKRQKVCNSCNTLTALHLQTLHKNAHKKRESLKKVRVRVARSCAKKTTEKGHPKGLLRLTSESLPNHSRITAVSLPWHCRGTAEHDALELAALAARGGSRMTHQNGIRTPDPGQDARGGMSRWAPPVRRPSQ